MGELALFGEKTRRGAGADFPRVASADAYEEAEVLDIRYHGCVYCRRCLLHLLRLAGWSRDQSVRLRGPAPRPQLTQTSPNPVDFVTFPRTSSRPTIFLSPFLTSSRTPALKTPVDIVAGVTSVFGEVTEKVVGAANTVADGVKDAANGVKDFFGGLKERDLLLKGGSEFVPFIAKPTGLVYL